MTDFDDWSKSEWAWVTCWIFLPSGKWMIIDQSHRPIKDHIKFAHEFRIFGSSLSEYHAINAFREFRKTGKPITVPRLHVHGNLFNKLRVAVGALLGRSIYHFVTISEDIDRTSDCSPGKLLEHNGGWL